MSNSLQALKTVTLTYESVLTALFALGRQRTQDKELLQVCSESSRAWVRREIAITDAAIAALSVATIDDAKKNRNADHPSLTQCATKRGQSTTWSSGNTFENRIVSLAPTLFALQFVRESSLEQLIDGIREITKTSHANAAVNITFIVSYADLHALHLDKFFDLNVQLKLVDDLAVEIRYLFAGEDGALHFFHGPSHLLSYVSKYLTKKVPGMSIKTHGISPSQAEADCIGGAEHLPKFWTKLRRITRIEQKHSSSRTLSNWAKYFAKAGAR